MAVKNLSKDRFSNWRPILLLALPVMAENFLQSMVGFVDTLFLSRLGLEEVAAVGIANAVFQIYYAVFLAVATASTILVSRAIGERNKSSVSAIISNSIYLTIFVGMVFGVISFFFAESLLTMMGANGQVLKLGTVYFQIVSTPCVWIAMMYTIGAIFRGAGDTKTPMKVGIAMNIIHVILDYVLIFGVFFHGLGIVGAALATVCARIIGVLLLFRQLYIKELVERKARVWKGNRRIMRSLARLGIPASFERLFMRFGQIIYFSMIMRMGVEVYSAHTLAGNFTIFPTMIGTGLAAATATLIGQSIGAKDIQAVRSYSKASMMVTALAMTAALLTIFLTSGATVRIFTDHQTVIRLVVTVLGIDTFAQPATAVVTALTAVLQAGGDTKYPMYVTAIGIWAIRTLGVYLLGVRLGFGLMGVWIAIALDNYIRALLLYWRYRSFKWIKNVS